MPGFDPTAQETAWKAVQVLRGMMPQLVHFARTATGNAKVQVEITTDTPHTKGNKIFIRPPLGLASKTPHLRSKCGERDASGKQVCQACQIREVIDFYLFHEIAHIAGKTQIEASRQSFDLTQEYINEWHHYDCEHWSFVRNELGYVRSRTCDSMTLLNVLNPYLPMIFNVLEDCRVNRMTFTARPGMEHIFTMNMERLLTEGSEVGIDQYLSWSEAPLDSQFMIGLQMVAANYQTQDTLHPDVQIALADSKIINICNRALFVEDAHGIFVLSLEVFRRAQELGFCLVPKCVREPEDPVDPPAEPQPEGNGETGDDGDAEGSGDEAGDGEGGPESGGDPGDSGTGEGDSGSSSGTDDSVSDGSGGPESEAGEQGSADPGTSDSDSGSDGTDSGPGGSDSGDADSTGGSEGAGAGSGGEGLDDGTSLPSSGGSPGDQVSEGDPSVSDSASAGGDVPGEGSSPEAGMADSSSDAQSNSTDAAGISGSGEQGATVQGSGELESQVGNAGNEAPSEVGADGEIIPSESCAGRDVEPTARDDRSDEVVASDGDSDSDAEVEAEDGEPDYPLDLESDNPWDIDNQEDIFGSAGSQQHGPMPTPTQSQAQDASSDMDHGTPDDVARDLSKFLVHGAGDRDGLLDTLSDDDLTEILGYEDGKDYDYKILRVLELAINQVGQFDAPSIEVAGNEIAEYPHWGIKWDPTMAAQHHGCAIEDLPELFAPAESLIGRVVLQSRRVFDDNLRAAHDRNRKSGRINTRVLGRRAPVNDPRLFQKKVVPAKRDYFVILGGDASFSTDRNMRNEKIKRIMHGLSDLLTRVGVPWAGYMHSAFPSPLKPFRPMGSGTQFYNYFLPFKEEHEAWNDAAKEKLASVLPISDNLDGHSFEYYRKIAMQHRATDRIVIYFTDGQMPAANKDEELVILEREIKEYKRQGIHLVCVGIQTDSPSRYGLPTVRVDSDEDVIKVIEFIGKILTAR